MKRLSTIFTIFFGCFLIALQTSSAFSFYQKSDGQRVITFSSEKQIGYFLKGSFNDWQQQESFKFLDNTATMTAETNKVKEFKLENVSLSKSATLKVCSDGDEQFENYEHSWSNEINKDGSNNYVVPMTSNSYRFYLKFYNDGTSKLYITANKDVLFFTPSNRWKGAGATFAIEQYNNSSQWVQNVSYSSEVSSGTFRFEIGTTYSKYKFARRDSSNSTTWNASNIQTLGNSDTNNHFSLWDNYYSGGEVWSDWDPTDGSIQGVSCGVWSSL